MSEARRDSVELYLLRHADAGDPATWSGDDDERPLSEKGRRQADALGRLLKDTGFRPEAILASPKLRARETARIVAEAIGAEVRVDDALASDVDLAAVERILDAAGSPGRVVLVGHDPDFSALLSELCGASGISMKKGALARVDTDRPLAPGSGVLRWLVPPDLLAGGR